MPKKKRIWKRTADDSALRQSYLEMYAARDMRKRLTRINYAMGIRQQTVDRWLKDPEFVREMQAIDQRRMESAVMLAQTLWPRIVEELASVAAGVPEEPPDVSDRSKSEISFLLSAHAARAAKRVTMSVRAAELIAKIIGAVRDKPTVAVYADNVERFGTLPDTSDALLEEHARLDAVLARARARAEQRLVKSTGGNGRGNGSKD